MNASACASPFCPVVASSTSSTSLIGRLLLDDAADLAELVHEPALGVQAAGGVDDHDLDALALGPLDGLEGDGCRILALALCGRTIAAPARSAQVASCSTAAARKVSAAPTTTLRSYVRRNLANLPIVVVLPTPFTPTTSTTAGRSVSFSVGS